MDKAVDCGNRGLGCPYQIRTLDVIPVSQQPETAIRLRSVRKEFTGGVVAVEGIDLDVYDGEFLTLLGPSGSGKTTVLRMIAGFELPTAGTIELGGVDVSRVPPFDRDVNTVFQDYALFPHMSVQDNVEYGLRVKRVGKTERRTRAREALARVRLEGYEDRRPKQLSGGQRQRVALARALVNQPRVLLLDEPLGALDLKLREQMQVELKAIQRDVGITFIFVTHDQEEALTMSDRVAVFSHGRIEQVGTAAEVYERPATEFVASFVGTTNLLTGEVAQRVLGKTGTFSLRPEKITLSPAGEGRHGLVETIVYLGAGTRYLVRLDTGDLLTAMAPNHHDGEDIAPVGGDVSVTWDPAAEYAVGSIQESVGTADGLSHSH